MNQSLDCAWLLAAPGTGAAAANQRIHVADGLVAALETLGGQPAGPRSLVIPALSNAHDHGRFFRSATLGAYDKPLESWLPFLGIIPGADPYQNAAATFARSVRHGIANLMVHYTRTQGGMPYVDEAREIARAARDVGNRIGLAVSMRDRHSIAYCDDALALAALRPSLRAAVAGRLAVPAPSVSHQMALVDEVATMVAEDGYDQHVTVQYGPNGVHWCSPELLQAIAAASNDTGRPVHMHLLETRYQREWADRAHPHGIVRYLDQIGLLSPRLTLAHCVWATPDELDLLAERGVTLAVNTSSNLTLKSGIAPVPAMVERGCRIALGLDACGVNEDDDPLGEMRLAYHLHRGWGYEVKMDRAQLWGFAAVNGAASVNGKNPRTSLAGCLQPGAPADWVQIDWEKLDEDGLFDIDPLDVLLARGTAAHVESVMIGGRQVVQQRRVCGIDEPALRAELVTRMRASIAARPEVGVWQAAVSELAEDLGPFYLRSEWHGCC